MMTTRAGSSALFAPDGRPGPARERNHVARVQLALAVGRAQGDLARDDDQELLVRPVPVERELA
jgi:hypothetical protein